MPCEAYTLANPDTVTVTEFWVCRPRLMGMGEAREWWCFECRKHQRHWLFLTNDEWYDPEPVWMCDGCWGDHTRFPA